MGIALLVILGTIVGLIIFKSKFAKDGEKAEAAQVHSTYGKLCATGCKVFFLLNVIFTAVALNAQEKWVSSSHEYSLEIPEGFNQLSVIGSNVDFKAGNGKGSVVVIVKALPDKYKSFGIWDIMGDLSTYETEWEAGAQEYFRNPDLIKYGKTKIDGQDTFWYNYTANNPKDYSRVYQTQKEGKIYTFTLTCSYSDHDSFSAVWYRFKHNIKFL